MIETSGRIVQCEDCVLTCKTEEGLLFEINIDGIERLEFTSDKRTINGSHRNVIGYSGSIKSIKLSGTDLNITLANKGDQYDFEGMEDLL